MCIAGLNADWHDDLMSGSGARPNFILGRAATRLARQVSKALGPLDLSSAQYQVLVSIDDGFPSISRIATRLSSKPPTVSGIVNGLVERGWVSRQQSEGDRRHFNLALTRTGKATLAKADRAVSDQMMAIADELGPGPRRLHALDGLELWYEALDIRVARRHPSGTWPASER